MAGEVNFFRKRFFGGFNREDVVGYIAKLSQERNALEAAKVKAENEVLTLKREIEELRIESGEETRLLKENLEKKMAVFEAAGLSFSEFEAAFGDLCSDIERVAENAIAELKSTGDAVGKLRPMLANAAERFSELRSEFEG